MDYAEIFTPTHPLSEMALRGTVIYLFLIILFRVLRREAGSLAITDLLLVVIIADAIQNAMSDDYKSITEGIVLVLTIAFWNVTIDWLAFQFPLVDRIVNPPKLPLIKDGKLIRKNLRRQFITDDELQSQLREHGIEKISLVKAAFLESDGEISIIKAEGSVEHKSHSHRGEN